MYLPCLAHHIPYHYISAMRYGLYAPMHWYSVRTCLGFAALQDTRQRSLRLSVKHLLRVVLMRQLLLLTPVTVFLLSDILNCRKCYAASCHPLHSDVGRTIPNMIIHQTKLYWSLWHRSRSNISSEAFIIIYLVSILHMLWMWVVLYIFPSLPLSCFSWSYANVSVLTTN